MPFPIAKAFIESDAYETILVIASEKISAIVDYKDRNTCILFGDGAFACLVTASRPGLKIGKVFLGADGRQKDLLMLPAGGVREPASLETVKKRRHYLKMDGKKIFRHAICKMELVIEECLQSCGLCGSDIAYFIPHQANIRIIDSVTKRFQIPSENVVKTIKKYGNTSASSIGLGLEELIEQKKVKNFDPLLLAAFGAGLTWASLVLTVEMFFE